MMALALLVMVAIRYSLRLASVTSLAVTYGMPAHPSSIGSSVANRRSHAKMPSTRLVPAAFQTSMMQRGRSWEGMLQRLSGARRRVASETHAKAARMGERAGRSDVRRRTATNRQRGAKHPLPEPDTRIKKEILTQNRIRVSRKKHCCEGPAPQIKKQYL